MESEEGGHEAHQSGTSTLISGAARTGPVLSPSVINLCKAYHGEHCQSFCDKFLTSYVIAMLTL